MYKVILHKDAEKKFTRADENLKRKLRQAIENIAQNPYHNIHILKLKGNLSNMHRYRMGNIRIICEI
ncbi:MAG: type II toxin-antitoxin system RelE/ParE family toxin, partial [Candidatus Sumerlaeota bacterium]|nr:type II toxin-antitoxin system RelE/ParE family toxin [Candidatus Sumerlaeota bacterium]